MKTMGAAIFARGQQMHTARVAELAAFSSDQAKNKASYDELVSSGSAEIEGVNAERQEQFETATAAQDAEYQNKVNLIETVIAEDGTFSFAEANQLLAIEKNNLAVAIEAATEEENSNYQAAKDAFGFDKIEEAEALIIGALDGVAVAPELPEGFELEFPEGEAEAEG